MRVVARRSGSRRRQRNRRKPRWLVLLFAGAVALAGCGAADVTADESTVATSSAGTSIAAAIPLELVDGSVPVVMVAVGGGEPVPLLVDTGSAGLRIFAEDAGPQVVIDPATEDETISFVDGTTYVSDKAIAPVTLGDVDLPAPVPVALVRDVTCEPDATSCEPGIAASKASGVHGILGIDMDTGDYTLPSPLLYLPDYRSFTVAYDDDGTGRLLPGVPSGQAIAAWDLISSESGVPDVAGWAQDFDACWAVGNNRRACVPTTFDTGATDLVVPSSLPGAPQPSGADEYLSAEQGPVELFAEPGGGDPVWRLQPGGEVSTSAYVGEASGDNGYDAVLAGTPLFYAFDVGFDHGSGQVGLWPRAADG